LQVVPGDAGDGSAIVEAAGDRLERRSGKRQVAGPEGERLVAPHAASPCIDDGYAIAFYDGLSGRSTQPTLTVGFMPTHAHLNTGAPGTTRHDHCEGTLPIRRIPATTGPARG
jgi:hypothetical protein